MIVRVIDLLSKKCDIEQAIYMQYKQRDICVYYIIQCDINKVNF